MSNSKTSVGVVMGTVTAFLGLIVAVLQLLNNVYGVGPAPITFVVERITEYANPEPAGPGQPPGSTTDTPDPTETVPPTPLDTEPPTVPQNLQGIQTGCDLILAWEASTDNSIVQLYRVYADGVFLGSTPGDSSTSTVSVSPGNPEARFTISAFDGSNESEQSNAVSAFC